MIFYCEELDEILLFAGLSWNGEMNHWKFLTPFLISDDLFKSYLEDHDWMFVGVL